jgi:hypothetical protein
MDGAAAAAPAPAPKGKSTANHTIPKKAAAAPVRSMCT